MRRSHNRLLIALLLAVILTLAAVAAGCGGDDAAEEVAEEPAGTTDDAPPADEEQSFTFRAATAEPVDTPTADAFDNYLDRLRDCSEGRLDGEHFPASQLGNFGDLIDGNRRGTFEMTAGGFDVEGPLAPATSALSLGYLIRDSAHVDRIIEELGDEIAQIMDEETGVTVVAIGDDGPRHLISRSPVRSLTDMRGMKVRTPDFEIPIGLFQALGASPTPTPFEEVYNALQTGVVDAAEGTAVAVEAIKFYEPAPNLVLTSHWMHLRAIRVNSEWLNGLPSDLQECVRSEAVGVFEQQRADARSAGEEALETMEAEGVEIIELPDLDEWRAAAQGYIDEYVAKYPEARDLVERVQELAE
jgi:TRAP-type transport system periplasmic protein